MTTTTCETVRPTSIPRPCASAATRVEVQVESDDTDERKGVYRLHVRVVSHGAMADEQRAKLDQPTPICFIIPTRS